jgi:hypothetical protein
MDSKKPQLRGGKREGAGRKRKLVGPQRQINLAVDGYLAALAKRKKRLPKEEKEALWDFRMAFQETWPDSKLRRAKHPDPETEPYDKKEKERRRAVTFEDAQEPIRRGAAYRKRTL